MKATIQQNKIGHLHVWIGDVQIEQVAKYNYLGNNKESEIYLQKDADIGNFLSQLPKKDVDMVELGYKVVSDSVSEDYFI